MADKCLRPFRLPLERAGLSQEALADLCDLHHTGISLLRCKRSPRLETIVILSRGLELAPGDLLEGMI